MGNKGSCFPVEAACQISHYRPPAYVQQRVSYTATNNCICFPSVGLFLWQARGQTFPFVHVHTVRTIFVHHNITVLFSYVSLPHDYLFSCFFLFVFFWPKPSMNSLVAYLWVSVGVNRGKLIILALITVQSKASYTQV